MGKPGRRLVVEAKPLTSDEEDEVRKTRSLSMCALAYAIAY